jgi:proteasome assembly chaperone 2
MENKFYKHSETCDWSEYTFIFPSVSIGNIGQLACDLLISSLSHTNKAGHVISDMVQPIVGHDAFVQSSTDLSLSCELYENKGLKLVILQQRAPLFKGKRNAFVKFLSDFIKKEKFKESICLTSSNAYERLDSQLSGIQCRYLVSDPSLSTVEKTLDWKLLEKRIDHNNNLNELKDDQLDSFIPGGGIAQKFHKMSKDENLNSHVLIVFAHEGNNIPEAIQLVNYMNEWKKYLTKSVATSQLPWRIPISWKYLFGQSIDPNSQMF